MSEQNKNDEIYRHFSKVFPDAKKVAQDVVALLDEKKVTHNISVVALLYLSAIMVKNAKGDLDLFKSMADVMGTRTFRNKE